MKMRRFVNPNVTKLTLSDGEWIEVRDELSVGEQRKAMARLVSGFDAKGNVATNLDQLGLAETFSYLTDWSFTDAQDKRVPVSESALANLTPDAYDEIEKAIQAHAKSVKAAQGKTTTDNT